MQSLTATIRTLPSTAGCSANQATSVQTVELQHLFACNAHPTELSLEDLWQNPMGSICTFSYIDNRNLDDGPSRGT